MLKVEVYRRHVGGGGGDGGDQRSGRKILEREAEARVGGPGRRRGLNRFARRKLLSKESSMANSSFRVYHGVASGAVPFLWESQPGTPKHTISVADLPPLTPPPSYYYYNVTGCKNSRRSPKSSLLRTILPRLCLGKPHRSPSSPSVSFSSSSSLSLPNSVSSGHRRRPLSPRSSFSWTGDDDEESNDGSRAPTLCFGASHRAASPRCS
ncbi:hypothetical protein GW17_00056182 [Ensete ventricosum]|nr:hypothetical protein GW17_00056182 [Ensete ventricosum]